MSDETQGVRLLRETVEEVASGLEQRRATHGVRGRARIAFAALAAASIGVIAIATWTYRPTPAPEVEILEMRIQGRPVTGIVVEDAAAGGFIVLPQIGGPPHAALTAPGGMP